MSLLIWVVLLWTSGRGTRIIGHLILICIHESATANAPLIINGAPSPQMQLRSHIYHTSFPGTYCIYTCFLDVKSEILNMFRGTPGYLYSESLSSCPVNSCSLPCDVIWSATRFRLCAHSLRIEEATSAILMNH